MFLEYLENLVWIFWTGGASEPEASILHSAIPCVEHFDWKKTQ